LGAFKVARHFVVQHGGMSASQAQQVPALHDVETRLNCSDPASCIMDRFLIIGTSAPCVRVGPHIEQCTQYAAPMSPSRESAIPLRWGEDNNSKEDRNALFTWLPRYRVLLLLCKISAHCTAVYVCETGLFFYASDVTSLPGGTPAGTILAAVYTEDVHGSHREPRVLVNDVLFWGAGCDSWGLPRSDDLTQMPANERYRILRENFGPQLQHEAGCIVLQWLGYHNAAQKFLPTHAPCDGAIAVGHKVGGLLTVNAKSALHPRIVCS
jgi:hypothetical protein